MRVCHSTSLSSTHSGASGSRSTVRMPTSLCRIDASTRFARCSGGGRPASPDCPPNLIRALSHFAAIHCSCEKTVLGHMGATEIYRHATLWRHATPIASVGSAVLAR